MTNPNQQAQQNPMDLPPGTILRKIYRIERKVGGGNMAVVYRAVEMATGVIWAIKEMRPQPGAIADLDEARKQFEQEADLLSRLDHPNLPKVVAHFEEAGRSYLVMEFVDGQTLDKCPATPGGMVSEQIVVGWTIQVCDVLAYLHAQKPPIIFRDLKPSNIMVTQAGAIKLIDFGIARTYKAGKKRDTTAMGSENYAPPEQWGQEQTDARSDVYALGATMYHLLTGKPPRIAFSPDPLESPCVLNPGLSSVIGQTVLRAMARERQDRFQTAVEFGDTLRQKQPTKTQIPNIQPPENTSCPNCRHPNRQRARFCGRCGTSLQSPFSASVQILGPSGGVWMMTVQQTPFRIGRRDALHSPPDLDLSPYDPQHISRLHAEIRRQGSNYVLIDMGSTNGTLLNGQRLVPHAPHSLHNRDCIEVGTVRLMFQLGSAG